MPEKNDFFVVKLSILSRNYYQKINIPKKYIKYAQISYNKNFTIGDFADILF